MPGIDFTRLRTEITMRQVLALIGFEPAARRGDQWYGACPLHESSAGRQRAFSVNVAQGRYYCHRCHSHGHQLDLWAAFTRQDLYRASIDLCHSLAHPVPWLSTGDWPI